MMHRAWFPAATFLLLLLLLSAGCKRKTPVEMGIKDQIIQLGNGSEPRDLDPTIASSNTESNILNTLFEGLVNYSPDCTEIVPGAAEKWEISPDGHKYTFHLRRGLKWSNGDALTSADFLYSFRRLIEPQLGAELAVYADWVVGGQDYRLGKTHDLNAVGYRAPDPLTFEITLNQRAPYYLGILVEMPFYPVHRPSLEKHDAYLRREGDWTRPGSLVSNGPFKLKEWRINEVVAVEKNPNYWDAAHVILKEAHFHPVDNLDAEERAFRGGLLHVTRFLPVVKLLNYRKDKSPLVHTDRLIDTNYIDFNVQRAPFNDVRVRRAFALALDRQALVRDVMRDGSRAADDITLPGSGNYTARVHTPFDADKARATLAEAGFPGGANFPHVSLNFTPSIQNEQALVEAIQGMWQRELGIHVDLVAQEEKVWLNAMRSKDFQLLMDDWLSGINDPVDMFQLFLGSSSNNHTGWDNPGYNEEYAAAGQAPDDAAREVHLQSMDAVLVDDLPMIPLFHLSQNYLVQPSVQNWTENMLNWHLLNHVFLQAPAPPAQPKP